MLVDENPGARNVTAEGNDEYRYGSKYGSGEQDRSRHPLMALA